MQDRVPSNRDDDGSILTLDRVWAATRPPELSGDEFDRIWAGIQQAYDRPNVLPMIVSPRAEWSRRALGWVPFGLANAAAILLAAWVLNRPVVDLRPVVAQQPNPPASASTKFDLEPYETLVIQIDGDVVRDRRDKADENLSLAFNDVPTNNQNDALNHWEALSND